MIPAPTWTLHGGHPDTGEGLRVVLLPGDWVGVGDGHTGGMQGGAWAAAGAAQAQAADNSMAATNRIGTWMTKGPEEKRLKGHPDHPGRMKGIFVAVSLLLAGCVAQEPPVVTVTETVTGTPPPRPPPEPIVEPEVGLQVVQVRLGSGPHEGYWNVTTRVWNNSSQELYYRLNVSYDEAGDKVRGCISINPPPGWEEEHALVPPAYSGDRTSQCPPWEGKSALKVTWVEWWSESDPYRENGTVYHERPAMVRRDV